MFRAIGAHTVFTEMKLWRSFVSQAAEDEAARIGKQYEYGT